MAGLSYSSGLVTQIRNYTETDSTVLSTVYVRKYSSKRTV